jgi:glutamate--cysteine ligase
MALPDAVQERLSRLAAAADEALLVGARSGLEKESLRVTADGEVATTPHPAALGSALTHPFITTDYSEALLELITPPFEDACTTLRFLDDVHDFVWSHLDGEVLWAASMPCRVEGDESIPIAWYGTSNTGRMKRIYRIGLGHRYGRAMQAIAGLHFNYSLPPAFWRAARAASRDRRRHQQVIADGYFALLRNFQRHGWIVPLLFGSSPSVCRTYLGAADPASFELLGEGTWYLPYATSLRMSDIGYKNETQAGLDISYDDLEGYVRSLTRAIETPYGPYEAIGVKVEEEYRQLNANLLQIENEYYSFIRPKQIARSGERPTLALMRRGVRYVEMRALDLNPYAPFGVEATQLRFLEAFLILCALAESPPIAADERAEIAFNQLTVAREGRRPGLRLRRNGAGRDLRAWAEELCDALAPICEQLDAEHDIVEYREALQTQLAALREPDRLPSARMLEEMRTRGESFFELAMRLSHQHGERYAARELAPDTRAQLEAEAERSHAQQQKIERADRIAFDEFLSRYLSQTRTEREHLLG